MDIEKLIERLKEPDCDECTYEEKRECAGSAKCVLSGYAAEALSTLQTENAQLRGELEYEQEHANAYHEECGQWEAENEKLQAELEQMKVERDAAVALVHEWEEYGRYLSPMGFTVPHNWRND